MPGQHRYQHFGCPAVSGPSQVPWLMLWRSRLRRDPHLSPLQTETCPAMAVWIHPESAALRKHETKTPLPSSSGWTTEARKGPRAKPPARQCQCSSLPAAGSPASNFLSSFCTLEQTDPVASPFPQLCDPQAFLCLICLKI